MSDSDYIVRFACPEFTSLCPITGQPEFAHLVIDYPPDQWLVESKSLKLFLLSFRNHSAFHEDCTVFIGKKFVDALAIEAQRSTVTIRQRHQFARRPAQEPIGPRAERGWLIYVRTR